MAKSALYKKGTEMRRKLMGEAFTDKLDKTVYSSPIMQKFGEATREAIFGTLWTRPGLDLKTRTMVTVVSDTATGRTPELRMHLRMALNQGWTENELVEAMVHLIGYVGAPTVREAMIMAGEVFAEIKADKK
jgi:4-carboxymuconolactone decarboxylase